MFALPALVCANLHQYMAVCLCVGAFVLSFVHLIFHGSEGSASTLCGTCKRVKVEGECEGAARGEVQQQQLRPPVSKKHLHHINVSTA